MYVITKKNVYEVQNEVYFAETIADAEKLIQDGTFNSADEWLIAIVIH